VNPLRAFRIALIFTAAALFATTPGVSSLAPAGSPSAVREARDLFAAGRFNAGILLLEEQRARVGEDAEVLTGLGDGYRAMGVWPDAGRFYRRALRADSSFSAAWAGLGAYLYQIDQPDSARRALERALALGPNPASTHGLLGQLALDRGEYPEARRLFERALQIEGETLGALTDLAAACEQAGDLAEARRLMHRAATLYPGSAEAEYGLALLESRLGNFHEAVLAANRALALTPQDPELLRFLGILYFERQVCAEAVNYFRSVLALTPLDLDVRLGLATCLHSMGESEAAVGELEAALGETDRDYDLLLLIANIHLEDGRVTEALRSARSAAVLDTLRPDARYLAGLALRRLGRNEEADREFRFLRRLRETEESTGKVEGSRP